MKVTVLRGKTQLLVVVPVTVHQEKVDDLNEILICKEPSLQS